MLETVLAFLIKHAKDNAWGYVLAGCILGGLTTGGYSLAQQAVDGRIKVQVETAEQNISQQIESLKQQEILPLKAQVQDTRRQILESRLFETRLRQCQAESGEARQFYARKLQDLVADLGKIDPDARWRVPDCAELI